MLNEYLLEPFLARFYLLESICGSFMTEQEKKAMFRELAEVFCLPDCDELRSLYEVSQQAHFSAIRDLNDYERLCRTMEFAEQSGQDMAVSSLDRMILAQKREAMTVRAELFRQEKNLTRETVSTALLDRAMNGSIHAMAILSYMEYHGICVCTDQSTAVKRLRLCARWNDLFGNLMGIAYDRERTQQYYDNLGTILRSATQKHVFDHICRFHGFAGDYEKNSIARIIERAFGLNIIKREQYDQVFARVAYSALIGIEDKEKLLLNKQKDAIVSLSDLPFDARWTEPAVFDETCGETLPLDRKEEVGKILQNLAVARQCPAEVYLPLLIVAQDEYLTEMYSDMLKKGLSAAPVVELDAAALTAQDLTGCRENVFLRGLSETKSARTVFLLKHCEELREEQVDELVRMLSYEYRRKFKLFQPAVSLDLSGLQFVLLAGERNSQVMKLAAHCDTVWTERIRVEEKDAVVNTLFHSRSASFGHGNMTMEEGCLEYLAAYDTRQVQLIVDCALRGAIFHNRDSISLSAIKTICADQNINTPKRGFGYMGGVYHASDRSV